MDRGIKFGVFADLHAGLIHDGQERLEVFLQACREEDVDFIVHLGDFCHQFDVNFREELDEEQISWIHESSGKKVPARLDRNKIVRLFNGFEKPSYHVLGNHECDMCSKRDVLDFYGMTDGSYYSFDRGGFHFVVLDPSFYKKDGEYIAYEMGNYFAESYHKEPILPYLPPEQVKWLREDLAAAENPAVLLSHQCLNPDWKGAILNADEVLEILRSAPAGVAATINGHDHLDYAMRRDGIWFLGINSMSNLWLGDIIVKGRYGPEVDEAYPSMCRIAPYRDSLFAFLTLDEEGILLKGRKSEFVGPSPQELGACDRKATFSVQFAMAAPYPGIRDRYMPFPKAWK